MSKKHYAAPTITDHGNAIERTKGLCGRCWEIAGKSLDATPIDPDMRFQSDDDR
jgi:hypothetical protein